MKIARRGKTCAAFLGLFMGTLLMGTMLTGCADDSKPKMSEADKENFKGGPMPADYKDPTMPGNQPPAAGAGAAPAGATPAAAPPAPAAAGK